MLARTLKILAFASLAALVEAQAPSSLNGPVTGYVFDPALHALRPIQGLPGASLFGAPVRFGYEVAAAFVAPRLDAALAIASDGSSHWFRIQGGTLQEVAVNGLAGAASAAKAAFSPSGSSLALYTAASVQLLTGLPDAPQVAGSVDLTNIGAPDAVALSDDGAALLVSTNNAIHLFGSYADLGKLMDTAGHPAMAFAPGGHDAAIADANAGVVLFHDLTGSGASQVVAAPDQNGASTSALAFSADGKTVYLASASAQTLTRLDLTAGLSSRLSCSCSPTTLARMGDVFRLTDLAADPLWLLDQPEGNARVVFVPAIVRTREPIRPARNEDRAIPSGREVRR